MNVAQPNTALESLGSNLVAPPEDVAAIPVELKRVKIILEENEHIPPTGQFFGVQGKGYVLRPGEIAEVPVSIINILNCAIMSVPVVDGTQRVVGYRDRLRFPYRVVLDS